MAVARSNNNALAIAWMALIVVCAGATAWIFDAGRMRPRITMTGVRVELPLPPADLSKVAGARPADPNAPVADAAGKPAAPRREGVALLPVDPMLVEPSPYGGNLPKAASEPEKMPWRLYAGYHDEADPRPRIAILLTGVGLSAEVAQQAIDSLPAQVSLSYSPYASGLPVWVDKARAAGHEAWVDLDLEPADYPTTDPGPATLLSNLTTADNIARLEWVLAQAPAVVGFAAQHGERMLGSDQSMAPIAQVLRQRGLAWIDNRSVPRPAMIRLTRDFALPFGYNDLTVHHPDALDQAFMTIESHAGGRRAALLSIDASLGAIERLKPWLASLSAKGFVLTPASAVVNRQPEAFALTVPQ